MRVALPDVSGSVRCPAFGRGRRQADVPFGIGVAALLMVACSTPPADRVQPARVGPASLEAIRTSDLQQTPADDSRLQTGALAPHMTSEGIEVAHGDEAEVTIRVGSRLISGWAFPVPSLYPGETVHIVVEPATDGTPPQGAAAWADGSVGVGRDGNADEEDATLIVPALINGWRLLPEFGIWVLQARPEARSRLGDPGVEPGLPVTDPDDGWTHGIVLDLEHAWVPGTLSADLVFIGPEPDPGLNERQRDPWHEDLRPARGRPQVEVEP